VLLDVAEVLLLDLGRELLAFDLLLEHVHQVHRVGGDFGTVEVEDLGDDLEGEARRDTAHALVDARVVAVLLELLAFGSVSLRFSPSYTCILLKVLEFSGSFRRVSTENWAIIFSVPGAHGAWASDELRTSFS
jgi:hypothetical protein